jgi:amidohydrolase
MLTCPVLYHELPSRRRRMRPGSQVNDVTLRRLRHDLHRNPEHAGNEVTTAQLMATFIRSHGPDKLLEGVGGTGIAARFDGEREGPTVMVRAELDAVPIEEVTGVAYRSQSPGVAHLCGHDGHMAMLAGLAARLSRRPPACGRVWLLLQPAEETGEGAQRVVVDAAFAEIDPDWVFALHNLPGTPLGTVTIRRGTVACGSIGMIVRLVGRSSHAGHPEQGLSPAPAVAQLIDAFAVLPEQVAASGEGEGFTLATVIHARLGEVAFGTTPGEATVMVTLRAEQKETLQGLRAAARQLASEVATAHDLQHQVEWTEEFPVTVNHDRAVDLVCAAGRATQLEVVETADLLRWSEDFGHFTERIPGALIGLGAGSEQPPLHSSRYDFPDDLIPVGVQLLSAVVDQAVQHRRS